MMKTVQIVFLAALLCGCARDRFTLVNLSTGNEIGPFTYRTGAHLVADGRMYQIRKVGTEEGAVRQYLRLTIIPEVQLCQADPVDVLHFLNAMAVEYGPTTSVWRIERPEIQFDLAQEHTNGLPSVTIRSVNNISLHDCLDRLCTQTGLKPVIDGRYIWLREDDKAQPRRAW